MRGLPSNLEAVAIVCRVREDVNAASHYSLYYAADAPREFLVSLTSMAQPDVTAADALDENAVDPSEGDHVPAEVDATEQLVKWRSTTRNGPMSAGLKTLSEIVKRKDAHPDMGVTRDGHPPLPAELKLSWWEVKVLNWKDIHSVSDDTYHELALMSMGFLPTCSRIRTVKKILSDYVGEHVPLQKVRSSEGLSLKPFNVVIIDTSPSTYLASSI